MLDETHRGAPQFDARAALARWAGVDLTRINGLAVTSVLSEIGPDLSRFTNVKHFCSWLGLCPGTKIGGGKTLSSGTRPSANRARQALKMAAMSLSRSHSALGAFYRQLCARMDKPRANTAVAHKLARMVHFMLTRGEAFVDQGQRHYEEQQHQRGGAGPPPPPAPPGGPAAPPRPAGPRWASKSPQQPQPQRPKNPPFPFVSHERIYGATGGSVQSLRWQGLSRSRGIAMSQDSGCWVTHLSRGRPWTRLLV